MFPVEISLSPVQTDAGSFISSVIRDVTERKQMEQEIIESKGFIQQQEEYYGFYRYAFDG